MGWIKAVKRGAPADQRVETITTGTDVPDPNILLTLVDTSSGVITNSLLAAPNAGPGYIKTFLYYAGGSNNATIKAVTALQRDTHTEGALLQKVGAVARFLWDGAKWSLIPGEVGTNVDISTVT